ncbi:MAG: type II secretion system F family protein, partial [Pirellulales bacterium]
AHYRKAVELQRLFLTSIAWPMIHLGMAIVVIGLLIWILGVIATRNNGQAIDILGFGLVGNRGLLIYTNFIIAVGLCIAGIVVAFRRGAFWIRPLQHLAMKIPGFGAALEKLALARLTWALHLTMNVEMDLRQLVPLVLRATGNDYYIRHTDQATRLVATGHPIHEAFAATGAFPADFLDALEVAEESGAVVESMERLSKRYDEESQAALKVITIFAGVAVWLIVMGLIILLIFRIFGFYLGTINDALKMTQ